MTEKRRDLRKDKKPFTEAGVVQRGHNSTSSLSRRKNLVKGSTLRQPNPLVLIVCEDEKGSTSYFKAFAKQHRIYAQVEVCGEECGSHPKSVVEYAVNVKNEESKNGTPYEQVWCVYDRDEHPNIEDAHNQAKGNGIHLAFSVPSFELWILLHFQYHSAHIERDRVNKKIQSHFPQYEKGKSYYQHQPCGALAIISGTKTKIIKILPTHSIACANADTLRKKHHREYNAEDTNPSTSIDLLITELLNLAKSDG